MTLIIAVLCADGIVVGADGAATLGVPNQATIRQPVHKLRILQNRCIIGTSGPVGLGQRLADEMDAMLTDRALSGKGSKMTPEAAMTVIRTRFFEKHLGPELHIAGVATKALGPAAQVSAVQGTLLAVPVDKKLCLFQFDAQGAPEMATADLPFVSIGSGQPIADPFLAFLRRVLWRHGGNATDPLPRLGDGIAATLWTLQHAIETNPGGVADPKQMMILRREKDDFEVRELQESELGEHAQAIAEMEKKIGEEWARLREPPKAGDAPQVPTPPGR